MAVSEHMAEGPGAKHTHSNMPSNFAVDMESEKPSMKRVVAGGSKSPAPDIHGTTRDYNYEPMPDPYNADEYVPKPSDRV